MKKNQKLIKQLSIQQRENKKKYLIALQPALSRKLRECISEMVGGSINNVFRVDIPETGLSYEDVALEMEKVLQTFVPDSSLDYHTASEYRWEIRSATRGSISLGDISMIGENIIKFCFSRVNFGLIE